MAGIPNKQKSRHGSLNCAPIACMLLALCHLHVFACPDIACDSLGQALDFIGRKARCIGRFDFIGAAISICTYRLISFVSRRAFSRVLFTSIYPLAGMDRLLEKASPPIFSSSPRTRVTPTRSTISWFFFSRLSYV